MSALSISAASQAQFDSQQLALISQLSTRDRQVRAHEQAHLAAAGAYATSGANYSYQKGPDGQLYAVGGEVSIDTSPDPTDPEKTIQKARQIAAAANAPADPSNQDRMVAAAAAQMEATAQRQLAAAAYANQDAPESGSIFIQFA